MMQRLRSPLPWHGVEQSDDELTDREILNVLRYAHGEGNTMLKTSEVAGSLPVTRNWTQTRLERLEDDGRVESREFGEGDMFVWSLSQNETTAPVPASPYDIGWLMFQSRRVTAFVYKLGVLMFALAGTILIPFFMITAVPEVSAIVFSPRQYSTSAIGASLAGAFAFILAGSLHLAAIGLKKYARQRGIE